MGNQIQVSAARCRLFKFDSISALPDSIFDIIGFARTSQEYHQRFLRTDKNKNFCTNFIKLLDNILKIKPIFGYSVIRYRFLMLFHSSISIFRNRFWVHIRCRFDILKNRATLIQVLYLYFLVVGPLTFTYQCIRLLTKSIIQFDSKFIYFLSDDQKHISMINPENLSFLSNK